MLHEIQPNEMPEFPAKNLNNVPPMNVDNFDMSRIITDMQAIQTKLSILQEAHETSLEAHVALCKEPQSNAQEQTSGQSTAQEPNMIGPVLQPEVTPIDVPATVTHNPNLIEPVIQPEVTPVEVLGTGTHNTTTSTENTQNAINDNGNNLDDILRLARLQGRLEERKI